MFREYLELIGVRDLAPACCPFDPGLAPAVLESHLTQSAPLLLSLKISMSCWLIGDPGAVEQKLAAARRAGVETSAGGGPYEVAVAQGALEAYLDLCAEVGFCAIEAGAGFTEPDIAPEQLARMTASRDLKFDYELGDKHAGVFDDATIVSLVEEGRRWLQAGARRLVVEARESASDIGLFETGGRLKAGPAERLADAFGLRTLIFEAPTKRSQFALLDHFGPEIQLGNVPMDEVLRVEIYRRGLHADAFGNPRLRPGAADSAK